MTMPALFRALCLAASLVLCDPAVCVQMTAPMSPTSPDQWAYTEDDLERIARQYAPVIFQEVDRGTKTWGDEPRGTEDFIAAVDFDGDLKSANNWENQPLHPLVPVVYYSLLETETHYFISYSVYHPRDWSRAPGGDTLAMYSEHENDMENVQVVIRKGGARSGVLLLLTQAHADSDFAATEESAIKPRDDVHLSPWPVVLCDNSGKITPTGTHVAIFIERKGHGIYSLGNRDKLRYADQTGEVASISKRRDGCGGLIWECFPVVQYVPSCGLPCEPAIHMTSGMDQEFEYGVPYVLESIYHEFWTKFEQGMPYQEGEDWTLCGNGELFDQHFAYQDDSLFEFNRVPRHFDADRPSGPGKTDAGISPFAIGLSVSPIKAPEECRVGLFFFNPAAGYDEFFQFPGEWSRQYVYNPYLISPLNGKCSW